MRLTEVLNPFKISVMKNRILLGALMICHFQMSAQDMSEEKISKLPEITIGVGILSFQGDVGKETRITDLSKFRSGYNLRIEERLTPFLSVALNGIYGKLAQSERSSVWNPNFESPLMQVDLQGIFRLDNGFILPKDAMVAPYVMAGFGYTKFDPHGDLKDKNGVAYNYWDDGSIRDLPQVDSNYYRSKILRRDYTYETKLTDPNDNYKRSTFSVPFGGGMQFKLSSAWSMNLNYTYYMTFTDRIDNFKNGGNDNFWFAAFGITYNVGGHERNEDEIRFADVDFGKLNDIDSDGDGVSDANDECQGTPSGAEVDSKGCPKDGDKDGILDYLDKQKDTPKGAIVDANGVSIDEADLERRQLMHDSLATERADVFKQNPSLRSLREIDAKIAASGSAGKKPLPAKFASADVNKDGIIQSSEMAKVIDEFLDGMNDFTVERINELIDYFFEQ